ncbi:MAG: alpha/beta fold hydrolase, partial [Pseudomonadales bacterium]|nr:alpha/beta fold hydrolase [Pseudomonadales bacterium]
PDVLPTFVAATAVSDPFDPQQQDVLAIFYVPNGYEETKRIEDNAHHEQLVQLEQTIVARVTEGFSIVPRFVIPVSEQGFYKTTSGKIQRSQFKKQFNEGHYQAQVDAYVQRNQASEQPLQHGLVWQWQSQPLLEFSQVQRDGASQVSVTTSTFSLTLISENTQNALSEYLADRWCQPKVIELGDFDSLNGDPVTATWQFNRKLSLIETVLAEPVSDQGRHRVDSAITLVAYSDNPLELMLLQPLVETLRQESGVANLGLVLTPTTAAKGLIDYRGIASIGWYEAGRMHRQVLENLYVPLNKRPSNAAKGIKNNGVYLVTGGLGALADPVIRWLVGSFNATVFLSGRANLSDHQRHQAAHSRLARLKTELGEDKIHYLYLPNWQEEELALRIDDALSSLASMSTASAVDINTLDGVFHLAGVMELQSLSQMDQAHWERVLDAKVSGSRAIVSYLQKRVTHSLLVQFGSVNGFFGGQSGAAYSLANAYQAQLTASLNQTYEESVNKGIDNSRGGLVQAWCVHWSFWKQTGMAKTLSEAQLQMAKNKGFLPLNPTVDDVQLQRFLSLPPNNYLMGIDPSNPNIASYVDSYKNVKQRLSVYVDISALDPAPTAVKLQQDVHTHWQALVPQCQSSELDIYISDEPLARTDGDWLDIDTIVTSSQVQLDLLLPENELEIQVAMVWQQVLDRDIENVERTFFEYGGHSINATQVVAMLNQRMGSQLTVANLFQYPSVRELAKLLAGSASQTSGMLSLAVADCLERARDYRLDQITKGNAANPALIFLPTASGISSVYWGMISSLKGYDCYAASLPVFSTLNESTAQADDSFTATRLADQAKPIAALIKEKVSSGQRCVLLGWSFAGVLAAELAALLQGYFKQTPDLIMMDSGFSRGLHEITFDTDFQLLMFAVELGLDIQDYAEFNQQLGKAAKLTWLQQRLAHLNQLFTANELNNYWARYAARLAALLNQSEPLIESLHTHQLVAALHSHGREDLGWEYSKSKINWHSIDADHQGIVKHPATIAWVVNYLRELKGR